jgi:hypothetical protein
MVVLSRAAGLPARLVVGYTSGAYDPDEGRFVVTAADAHAWAEVYMPPFGWIEFEPTGGEPELARPGMSGPPNRAAQAEAETSRSQVEELTETPPLYELPQLHLGDYWYLLGLGALVAAFGAGAFWWELDRRRLGALLPSEAVGATYQRLRRYGGFISVPMQAGDTPYEFEESLQRHLAGLRRGRLWDAVLAPALEELKQLVGLHVALSYTARKPDLRDKWAAVRLWDRLRLRLLLAKLWPRPR